MPHFDLDLDDLRAYRPDVEEPHDFDEFWRETIAQAREFELDVALGDRVDELRAIEAFDVSYRGWGGDPIAGWFIRPRSAEAPLPAIVWFAGYGGGRGLAHEHLAWAAAGYAVFVMDTRGQGSMWGTGGVTADPVGSGPAFPGFTTRGIDAPDTYYYRRVFTDAVRAVDAVRHLDGVDPQRVAVAGGSQAGGIALAVGGILDDLVGVMSEQPFLCHFRRAVSMSPEDPYGEIARYLGIHRGSEDRVFRTLSYFDGVNFAKRASAPGHFSVGLMDQVCPPSTVFAAINHYAADRTVEVYPYNGHEGGHFSHWPKQVAWLEGLSVSR